MLDYDNVKPHNRQGIMQEAASVRNWTLETNKDVDGGKPSIMKIRAVTHCGCDVENRTKYVCSLVCSSGF